MEAIYILCYKYSFSGSLLGRLEWLLSKIISIVFCLKYQHVGIGIIKKKKTRKNGGRRRDIIETGTYYDICFGSGVRMIRKDRFIANEHVELKINVKQRKLIEKYLKREYRKRTGYNYTAFFCNFIPICPGCLIRRGNGLLCTQLVANCLLQAGLVKNEHAIELLRNAYNLKVGALVDIILKNTNGKLIKECCV